MTVRICAAAFLSLCTLPVLAAEEESSACLEQQTTAAMVECLGDEARTADGDLNEAYRAAIEPLEGARRTALRDVQRAWIVWRDANCGFYRSGDGSIAAVDGAMCMVRMTRERTDELRQLAPL